MESIIGIDTKLVEDATGETSAEFKALDAGCYKATIKQVLMYENKYGDKSMRYIITTNDGEVDVRFKNDINSTIRGGAANGGYANRFKQMLYATNTEESSLTIAPETVKIKSFNTEVEAQEILGMKGKPVIANILLINDTNKKDGEPYKLQNRLAGVLAPDGTDASGDNKAEAFAEKALANPLTDEAGYIAKSKETAGTVDAKIAEESKEAGF